jgi:hypothetical protein
MAVLFVVMKTISHHYLLVQRELVASNEDGSLPARIHAIVLVSKVHKPTLRAVAYARASRRTRSRRSPSTWTTTPRPH